MTRCKIGFLILGCVLCVSIGMPVGANAQGFALPPAYAVPSAPNLVVIPGTYVYVIPGISMDILFWNGSWYRPYEGRWYMSRSHRGPWAYVRPNYVPPALTSLPGRHAWVQPGHRPIPYGQFTNNWKRWERDGYWQRDDHWRRGQRHENQGHGRGGYDHRVPNKGHGGHGR
jgi:hypothetical protein